MTLLLVVLACVILLQPLGVMWSLVAALIICIGLIKPQFLVYIAIFSMSIAALKLKLSFGKSLHPFVYTLMPVPMILALLFWTLARLAKLIPGLGYTTSLDLPILVMWVSAIISLLWTPHFLVGLTVVFQLTMGVMYYFVLTRLIRTQEQIALFYRFWMIIGLITLAGIFYSSYLINQSSIDLNLLSWTDYLGFQEINLNLLIIKYNGTREFIFGIVGSPKGIAMILNLTIPCVTIFLLSTQKTTYRVLLIVFLVLLGTAHLLAASRSELGGLLLGWAYVIYRNPAWRPKFLRYQMYLGLIALVALGSAFFVVSLYPSYGMVDFLGRLGIGPGLYRMRGGSSGEGRIFKFFLSSETLYETGGLGYGVGGLLPEVDPTLAIDVPNMPAAFLFDHGYGVLSLILFCWIYLNVALEMRRVLQYCQDQPYFNYLLGIAWILVAYGAASFLDHHFAMENYWIVLGFGMAAVQVAYLNGGGLKNRDREQNLESVVR